MSRVKRGMVTKKRHKRLLKQTKGYYGQRKNVFCRAKETLMRAWAYAFHGRKLKKRNMRTLFIVRINAAVRQFDYSYSTFIASLKKANIVLNRKMLAQIAVFEPTVFAKIVHATKK
ncbi:50S ribosomal protein L20 [Candidatus Chromulinivorax destructor]|uniref:Large ribosomal subunit protein bL20 n=1 Tax=Candidatus Chromulinivorax destructor TaxID=2066483 RepID=A0A345ZA60_9BACT|nr:50S ribosomal protein L20 [Candidatus Chromulinivorax destructor]AXK60177.1 50S ribosomal protein L20 [Candidatus Chromulinivorax destructor]